MNTDIHQLACPMLRSHSKLDRQIRSIFYVQCVSQEIGTRTYLDSFDWRLFKSAHVLESDYFKHGCVLLLRNKTNKTCLLEYAGCEQINFGRDLPDGKLGALLQPVIEQRAFMDTASVPVRITSYELKDDQEKIILRLRVISLYRPDSGAKRKSISSYVELLPLRGYEKHAIRARKLLTDTFDFAECEPSLEVFDALKILPNSYKSKTAVNLSHDMSSHEALSRILIQNLNIMEKNTQGIREDIDIEFLHDFRVAGRRNRSLINQVRDIFPQSRLKKYQRSFSWLSQSTSLHRDLDVFLSDFDQYLEQLTGEDMQGLITLKQYLQKTRQTEHRKLVRVMNSVRYKRFQQELRAFISSDNNHPVTGPSADTAIIEVANHSIRRCYRRLMKHGKLASANYCYESIHDLRKNGKKLRYLVEGFRSLYPTRELQQVVNILKNLQTNLGEIVDMHTQRILLTNWELEMNGKQTVPENTIKAIENLSAICNKKEEKAQEMFKQRFRQFSSKTNQNLFNHLFA